MRAHGPAHLRSISAVLRLAVLVLPAGIMAVLGYDFMARLVGFLLAAEQPVQYVYEGADGLVTVKADRYYIDFERGEVSFTRPTRSMSQIGG